MSIAAADLPDTFLDNGVTKSDISERADLIMRCGRAMVYGTHANGSIGSVSGHYCHTSAVCPVCASRIQRSRVRHFSPAIEKANKKYGYAYHLIATIDHGSDTLKESDQRLRVSWRRFTRAGQRRGRAVSECLHPWSKVRAAIGHFEIKRGQDGRWHPHLHVLAFAEQMIDFRADKKITFRGKEVRGSTLSIAWHKATEGQAINMKAVPLFGRGVSPDAILDAANEILKYDCKPSIFSTGRDLIEAYTAIRGTRRMRTYGDFVDIDDEYTERAGPPYHVVSWDTRAAAWVHEMTDTLPGIGAGKSARVEAAKCLGTYRGQRNNMVAFGGAAVDLDGLKTTFRMSIREIYKSIADATRAYFTYADHKTAVSHAYDRMYSPPNLANSS